MVLLQGMDKVAASCGLSDQCKVDQDPTFDNDWSEGCVP